MAPLSLFWQSNNALCSGDAARSDTSRAAACGCFSAAVQPSLKRARAPCRPGVGPRTGPFLTASGSARLLAPAGYARGRILGTGQAEVASSEPDRPRSRPRNRTARPRPGSGSFVVPSALVRPCSLQCWPWTGHGALRAAWPGPGKPGLHPEPPPRASTPSLHLEPALCCPCADGGSASGNGSPAPVKWDRGPWPAGGRGLHELMMWGWPWAHVWGALDPACPSQGRLSRSWLPLA